MPEVVYRHPVGAPVEQVWDFVKDIHNWAPMMTGYQSHEEKSDRHSIWVLKGDVGILSRTVTLDVKITDWSGPERVVFELEGIGEAVSGGGAFEIVPVADGEVDAAPASPPAPRPSLFKRLLRRLFGFLYRRKYGAIPVSAAAESPDSELVFTWRMEAGGPTAPLVNAMLGPAMEPAAENLAAQIGAAVEAKRLQSV